MTDNAAPVRSRTRVSPSTDAADAEQPTTSATAAAPAGGLGRRSRVDIATGATSADGDTSWMNMGDDGVAQAERVRQERATKDAEAAQRPIRPMRYRLSSNFNNTGIGEQGDIVILDAKPGPRVWEHRARDPRTGYWNAYEQCPHEWDNCPLCPPEGEKSPYYVMFLTVIDMREFTDREGVLWAATRKLLPIKIEQQGFFDTLYKTHGSLRGIHLIMTRDGGRMSAEIGNNIQFDCIHNEEQIKAYAEANNLWNEYKQPNGRVIWAEGEFIQPYAYGKIFERPSGAKLRLKYAPQGQDNTIGSSTQTQGDGWRNGTAPGRAQGAGLQRSGSTRRVNLEDSGGTTQTGGANAGQDMDDELPF